MLEALTGYEKQKEEEKCHGDDDSGKKHDGYEVFAADLLLLLAELLFGSLMVGAIETGGKILNQAF